MNNHEENSATPNESDHLNLTATQKIAVNGEVRDQQKQPVVNELEGTTTPNKTADQHNADSSEKIAINDEVRDQGSHPDEHFEEKSKQFNEDAEKVKRSFLQRHAFVITLVAFHMVSGLMWAVKGQYRYQFFHSLYADQLKNHNITKECGTVLEPEVQAIENKISAETSSWQLYAHYISTPLIIMSCFVIGMKSDQIGRRLVFLFPFVTSIANCVVIAVVIRFNLHYGYTLIGDFIYGLSGQDASMVMASNALVSDTHGKKKPAAEATTSAGEEKPKESGPSSAGDEIDLDESREKSRAFKIVLLHIVPSLFASIVSFGEGYVIAYAGFFWTMIIVVGLQLAFFIFAIVFVTETGEQRRAVELIGPLKTIGRAFKDPTRRIPLLLVNLGLIFSVLANVEEHSISKIYEMSPPFCLRSIQLGWLGAENRVRGIFAIPLMWLWGKMRLSESTIAAIGTASMMAGTVLLATVRQTWVFFADSAVAIPGALSSSMTKAVTTRLIGRSALASTFAVLMAAEELFAFVGGVAGNYLYQNTLDVLPTAAFYLSCCLFLVATLLYFAQTVYQWRTGDAAGAGATLNIQSPTDSDRDPKTRAESPSE